MCILIFALPEGSQLAVRDVAEAYRTVPLHHSQWPAAVVRVDADLYAIDTCAAFGASPSGGVFGTVADAACDIFRAEGFGPLSKWVDDCFFVRVLRSEISAFNRVRKEWHTLIRSAGVQHSKGRRWFGGQVMEDGGVFDMFEDCYFPLVDRSSASPRSAEDQQYAYNMEDIDRLSDSLGIPWQRSKDVNFSFCATYFGLAWNLKERTVALPESKASKYRAAIVLWQSSARHDLKETQQLYGKLLHASLVVPAGRARLVGLECALVFAHRDPLATRFPPRSVARELA
ncbi:hypothetical protein CVT24_012855 [Panaeolus cyanescens]|uniref:Reverse transcriptase domain-containing protein n=1 Tax=Panaeolus cyanescens TaxID=181874 RepID=A0A409WUR4_9AGAR|nr:hypothetical protein CVT24_012855 [Panaeolus cyanescens]